jgi:hypothetical protein
MKIGDFFNLFKKRRQLPPVSAPLGKSTIKTTEGITILVLPDIMKRMRKVDPNQARRYRQRNGE